MSNQRTIRPFFALVMMLVMALSITPKRTVHEIFGCHDTTTTSYKHSNPDETSFDKAGFHCACEQQEFQTPFVNRIAPQYISVDFIFSKAVNAAVIEFLYSNSRQLQTLRGPPALV